MPPSRSSEAEPVIQARAFAERIADLLNRTVANGIRLTAVLDQRSGECRISSGITTANFDSSSIALSLDQRSPSCYLDLVHRLRLDPEGQHLTDERSRYALYRDRALGEPYFRYEYKRGNTPHSEVHLHVIGDLDAGLPTGVRPLRKLHLPLGARRFRFTLEDLVEFLVVEHFAVPRPGWETAVQEHRQRWNELQLRAAVRRDPEVALDALRQEGRVPSS